MKCVGNAYFWRNMVRKKKSTGMTLYVSVAAVSSLHVVVGAQRCQQIAIFVFPTFSGNPRNPNQDDALTVTRGSARFARSAFILI